MTPRNLKHIEALTDSLPTQQRVEANYAMYGRLIAQKRYFKTKQQQNKLL